MHPYTTRFSSDGRHHSRWSLDGCSSVDRPLRATSCTPLSAQRGLPPWMQRADPLLCVLLGHVPFPDEDFWGEVVPLRLSGLLCSLQTGPWSARSGADFPPVAPLSVGPQSAQPSLPGSWDLFSDTGTSRSKAHSGETWAPRCV